MVKKRYGEHETAIRELRLRPGGIEVGEPVRAFSGVLAGSPTYEGDPARPARGGGR